MIRAPNQGRVGRRQYAQALQVIQDLGIAAMSANPPKASKKKGGKRKRADGFEINMRQGASAKVVSKKTDKKKSKPTLKKRVDELEKDLKQDMSYRHRKYFETTPLSCNVGKAAATNVNCIDRVSVQQAITALPIGTGTAINATTVAENTQINIKDCWGECVAQNITDAPLHVSIYAVVPVSNTSVSPNGAFISANDDMGYPAAAGGIYEIVAYPTEMPDFRKTWKSVGHAKGLLNGGDKLRLTATIPDFVWSNDYYTQHPFTYLKKRSLMFLVRIHGDICYDSDSVNRGSTLPGSIMCLSKGYLTVEYSGNVSSRSVDVVNSMDTGAITGVPTSVGPNVITIT